MTRDWRTDDYDQDRTARLNRWRRTLDSPAERRAAWIDMAWSDHGWIRLAHLNLHRISDRAWRSAQPWPHQIRRLAGLGVRSVVNLRGGQTYGSLPLEVEACAAAGVHFENFVLRSRGLPGPADIAAAAALFERLEYPVLFHCKSGADRAGMMCALYLVLAEGRPVREAARQLGLAYGHVRAGKTGILDSLFAAYLTDHPDESVPFADWVRDSYDPAALTAAFQPSTLGSLVTETLLRRE